MTQSRKNFSSSSLFFLFPLGVILDLKIQGKEPYSLLFVSTSIWNNTKQFRCMGYIGTCLIGAMTGLLNVTMPSLIRGGFGEKAGALMGLYTSSMTLSSALIVTLSQILALLLGSWQLSMMSVSPVVSLAIPVVHSFIPNNLCQNMERKRR